ncbi:hypothetical protein BDA96_07G142600 [Sorghum bicolor]|uniref:Uncharacterized protein n=2 Tax=Sorghum bicolor TaxID=4558 RepID=A0A921QN93_SORBI|nr:hypothetical protein BDA96_07G142600 [Sorghum bicolor]KXG25183.1 hypothetical protein SORBI_3007G133100 [Sorghum bicolor]
MQLKPRVHCPAIDREMEVMAARYTDRSELSPAAARETTTTTTMTQGAAGARFVRCEGVVFTLTEDNEVAQAARGGAAAARVLGSESFLDDAATCTRHHFVDVQGKGEAMLFLVSVREDHRCIVDVRRFS